MYSDDYDDNYDDNYDGTYEDTMTERMLADTFVRSYDYDEDRPAKKKKTKKKKNRVEKPSNIKVSQLDNQNKIVITIDKVISITLDANSALILADKIKAIE